MHGDSTGQGEETNVEANNNSRGGGRPVDHKKNLGILIFLVFICFAPVSSLRFLLAVHLTCSATVHSRVHSTVNSRVHYVFECTLWDGQ